MNLDPANMVLYTAISGVMPDYDYGMHLCENRKGQMLF